MTIAIYAGSFDPVTNGHMDVLKGALRLADKVIVAIGIHPMGDCFAQFFALFLFSCTENFYTIKNIHCYSRPLCPDARDKYVLCFIAAVPIRCQ